MTCIYIHRIAERGESIEQRFAENFLKIYRLRSYDLLNSGQISYLGISVGRQEDPGDMYVSWSVVTKDFQVSCGIYH